MGEHHYQETHCWNSRGEREREAFRLCTNARGREGSDGLKEGAGGFKYPQTWPGRPGRGAAENTAANTPSQILGLETRSRDLECPSTTT